MRESSCCRGIGVLGRIHPQVHDNPRHSQCPLSASAVVIYAVAPTIVQKCHNVWGSDNHASDFTSNCPMLGFGKSSATVDKTKKLLSL